MCAKCFQKVDHIDCKIIGFLLKRRASFIPRKIELANFESSWLKTFALHKVEAFGIMLGN
jgi:hypothetical protein